MLNRRDTLRIGAAGLASAALGRQTIETVRGAGYAVAV